MSSNINYQGEYILESDEGSPLPIIDNFNENLDGYDTTHYLDASRAGQPKDHFESPAISHLPAPQVVGSPLSQDSLSDSSSSKRTGSTRSTKSPFTGGDTIMSDGNDVKEEAWKISDFVNDDEETGEDTGMGGTDGTINPSALEPYQFGFDQFTNRRDPISASNSPSPFNTSAHRFTPDASLSPTANAGNSFSPSGPRGPRGHSKAPSYSLTKTMHGLTTAGPRGWTDPSLAWNVKGDEGSPPALFNSPSSPSGLNFDGMVSSAQNGNQVWHPNANDAFVMAQQMAGGAMGFQQMSMPMQGIPPFSFQPHHAYRQGPPYNLRIGGVNSKSRVETQIRITIIMSPLPPGIRRLHLPTHTVSKPKLLAKPTPQRNPDMLELHTALYCTSALQDPALKAKALERSRAAATAMKLDPLPEPAEGEENVSQGQSGAEVHICENCISRERKRASRKKLKKPEDDKLWLRDERRRIVVFNSLEVRDWSPPSDDVEGFSVDCQMRIACYCRHHLEKLGFTVIFTITDYQGNFIGQAMSSSIMITDDHKTHGSNSAAANSPDNSHMLQPPNAGQDMNSHSPPGVPIRLAPSPSTSELQPLNNHPPPYPYQAQAPLQTQMSSGFQVPHPNSRLLSRPASPTSLSGPNSKKRKASGPSKVPSGLSMTRIDTGHVTTTPPHQQASAPITSATSPSAFSPMPPFQSATEQNMFGPNGTGPMPQAFATGPLTPNGNEPSLFVNGNGNGSRATSYDHTVMANAHMYSAPASTHPSRAASPGGFRNTHNNVTPAQQHQNGQFAQALANGLATNGLYNNVPMGTNAPPQPRSVIHKIIPAEGPKSGGIEVTILGSGFQQGLEVMFGDVRATTTTFWGESSLVCLLPPSPISGTVLVSLKHLNPAIVPQVSAKGQPTFKYTDDDEQQLMRTALTVLGHKMNGKVEDISDIARRIIGNMDANWNPSSSAQNGQRQGGGGGGGHFNGYSFDSEVEGQLLKVLELIDLDDGARKPRLNLRRSTGQTMLHLACALGFHRFVAGLLARGANPDLHDKGGYTPLHMASLNDHPEIVRRLITCGADPTLRTLSGLTAADVARSHEVVRAIRRVERHVRSRSVGSLNSHSRASSLTSLKSLWDPHTAMTQITTDHTSAAGANSETGEESPEYSGEESPEYSSENIVSEEDPDDDNGPWMESRRSSTVNVPSRRNSLHEPRRAGVAAGLQSPAAAVTAFKDQMTNQLHNFHQAMALHLQNMPQFPYLPQMPAMAPLTDYQAYLNSAAVFQRLASMVPNIRPGSAGDQPPNQGPDGKWWDMSSVAAPLIAAPSMTAPTPPPAYDEIYPQGDLDKKQASAAGAAAEAEADQKCTALYDQPQPSSSTTETQESITETTLEPSQPYKAPALLQIGRKNAITKEQQENLQRARAEKLKTLSRDRALFFIWIPLLLIVICAMLYSRFPSLPSTVKDFFLGDITGNPFVGLAAHNMQPDRHNMRLDRPFFHANN